MKSAMTLHPFFDVSTPIAFAHRGGDERYPENTLAAFQYAYDLGYRYFETDVHYTIDNELVAFHDDNLFRTLGLKGAIANMTKHDRQTKLINGAYPVPLFKDLLEAFPDVYFNVDAKKAASIEPLVKTIKEHKAEHRVCLASFSAARLKKLRKLMPELPTITSGYEIARLRYKVPFITAPEAGIRYLQIPAYILFKQQRVQLINKKSVSQLHAKGCKVYVWTVNEEAEMNRLLGMNVDGLFTDKLALLKRVLQDRGQWVEP